MYLCKWFFVCVFSYVSQCKKYRDQFTDQQKLIYEEKLEASELFKDKKALYPSRYVHRVVPAQEC